MFGIWNASYLALNANSGVLTYVAATWGRVQCQAVLALWSARHWGCTEPVTL